MDYLGGGALVRRNIMAMKCPEINGLILDPPSTAAIEEIRSKQKLGNALAAVLGSGY